MSRDYSKPSLIVPIILWLLCIAGMIALVASLSGCAAVDGICGVQPIGQNEAGVAFFRYHCEPA